MLAFSPSVGSRQGFSTSLAEPAMTNRSQETTLTLEMRRSDSFGAKTIVFMRIFRSLLGPAQSSLKVSFVPEPKICTKSFFDCAKRPENIGVLLRRHRADSLRGLSADSAFLSEASATLVAGSRSGDARRRISTSRPVVGSGVRDDRWIAPRKQNADSSV